MLAKVMSWTEKACGDVVRSINQISRWTWFGLGIAVSMVFVWDAERTYGMLGLHALGLSYLVGAIFLVGVFLIKKFVPKVIQLHTIFLVLTPMTIITYQYTFMVADNRGWDHLTQVFGLPIKVLFL